VYFIKLGKENTKGIMVRPRWNLEVKRACFCFSGAFKTYANLWEGENQVIPIQKSMSGWEGAWVVPRPGEGGS
jgi:hypothetical protein